MLLERATGLAAKIAKYQELANAADQAAQFHTRANQFGGLAESITRARQALEQLVQAGVPVEFVPAEGAGYAAKAKELRAAISSNPAAINDPPFDLKYEFIDRISAIVAKANQAMMDAWKTYVAKRNDFGSDDVLSALAAVPRFRKSVARIREYRSDIATIGNSMPSDPQMAVGKLDALVAAHNAAWAELSAEDIPKSVLSFVKTQAGQDVRRKANAVFVLCSEAEPKRVLGYYTLCAMAISHGEVPEAARKHVPRYPLVSCTLIGRLAVAKDQQGQRLGSILLADALLRAFESATSVGSCMVVVDALDEAAAGFYAAHGFVRLPDSLRLVMPMRQAGGGAK